MSGLVIIVTINLIPANTKAVAAGACVNPRMARHRKVELADGICSHSRMQSTFCKEVQRSEEDRVLHIGNT